MKQLLQNLRSGETTVAEVPIPTPQKGEVLIRTAASLVSAGTERMLPGTGAFPVKEFLRMVPPGVPIGMEVPLRSLREGGVSALERTRRVLEATRELQRVVARAATGG